MARLGDVGEGLERSKQWPGAKVLAAFVWGEFLDVSIDVERVQLVFVVDLPAAEVPWMSRPAQCEALASFLRLDKLPLSWCWRPAEWPVWNHQIIRAVRFWTIDEGVDRDALAALASGDVDSLVVSEPDRTRLVEQLQVERDTAWSHLVEVTDRFHDAQWRRTHRGDGVYPEDHLWQASAGYVDLQRAIENTEI
jgi:hypothetical protein